MIEFVARLCAGILTVLIGTVLLYTGTCVINVGIANPFWFLPLFIVGATIMTMGLIYYFNLIKVLIE